MHANKWTSSVSTRPIPSSIISCCRRLRTVCTSLCESHPSSGELMCIKSWRMNADLFIAEDESDRAALAQAPIFPVIDAVCRVQRLRMTAIRNYKTLRRTERMLTMSSMWSAVLGVIDTAKRRIV